MDFREYSFEKLLVWQKAKDLTKVIYKVTNDFPGEEKFGFVSQMRRSAVSVPSNLAEGTSRITNKDKAHFTTQAYSSLMELLNHSIITHELDLMPKEHYVNIRNQIDEVSAMISGLRKAQLNNNNTI